MAEWRKLVGPGYVWVSRMNAMTWVGVLVMLLFALSLVRDIHGNTVGLADKLAKMDTAPASWWERFMAAPMDTIRGTASAGVSAAKPRPALDHTAALAIRPVPPTSQILVENLTKPGDLKTYIDDNLKALAETGKLAAQYPPCDPLEDLRKPWVNAKTGQPDIPRCLTSKAGDTIWMVSLINDGNQYVPRMVPWIGAFHKDAKGWAYYNVDGLAGGAKLQGYKAINWEMVPYQMGADFPYLIANEGEAK